MKNNNLILSFENVYYYFSLNDDFPILEDISFKIYKNNFIAIVGPNGSGKTTLAKLILGLYKPSKGKITYYNSDKIVDNLNIAYVPQFLNYDPLYPIRGIDIVLSGRLKPKKIINFYKKEDYEISFQIMKELNIDHLWKKSYQNLSGGQKQKFLIARALATGADFLIFDEPTSNLDRETQIFIYEKLSSLKERKTIILISHDIDIVPEISETIFCLNRTLKIHNTFENIDSSFLYNCQVKKIDHKDAK